MATETPEQPEHPYKTAVNAVGGFFGNIALNMAGGFADVASSVGYDVKNFQEKNDNLLVERKIKELDTETPDRLSKGIMKPMTTLTPHVLEDPRNFPAMVKNREMSQSEADRRTRNEWGAAGDTSHPKQEAGDMPSPPPILGTNAYPIPPAPPAPLSVPDSDVVKTALTPLATSPLPSGTPPAPLTSNIDVTQASKPGAVTINQAGMGIVAPSTPPAPLTSNIDVTQASKPGAVTITSAGADIAKTTPTLTAPLITNTPTSPATPKPPTSPPTTKPPTSPPASKPEKREQAPLNNSNRQSLNYNNSVAEAVSSLRNQNNISEMESKFRNLNDIRDNTKNNITGGGSSDNSSSVTTNNNNNQQSTVVSADHLDRLRRSFQQLPSWRTDIG